MQQAPRQFDLVELRQQLADEAIAFMTAKQRVRECRTEYQVCRDEFLARNPIGERQWHEVTETKAFQFATGKPYRALRNARQDQYNAERRMERRFRNLQVIL